jgi:hypothetical protein
MIKYDNRSRMCVRMEGLQAHVIVPAYVPKGVSTRPFAMRALCLPRPAGPVGPQPPRLLPPGRTWVCSRQAALRAAAAALPRTSAPAAAHTTSCSQVCSGGVGAGAADGLVAGAPYFLQPPSPLPGPAWPWPSGGVGAGAADGLVAGGRAAQGGGVQRGARPDHALPQLRILLPQLLHLRRRQQGSGLRVWVSS